MTGKTGLLTAIIVLLGAATASAIPITYRVDRTVGAGSVAGWVETDGTLGVLTAANILDWNLTFTSPDLYGGSPQAGARGDGSRTRILGNGVIATASSIVFDFDVGVALSLQSDTTINPTSPWWCLANNVSCDGPGEMIGWNLSINGAAEHVDRSGRLVIATVAVPEPVTLSLFGVGLLGFALTRRRKDRVLAPPRGRVRRERR